MSDNKQSPKPKIAVVTGANRVDGIGFAVAKQLSADPNILVVLTGRAEKDGATVLNALNASNALNGSKARTNVSYATLDQSDDKSVESFLNPKTTSSTVLAAHDGRIDILVNNAGALSQSAVPALQTNVADVLDLFNVNAVGPLRLMLRVMPGMEQRKYGRIVNVTSVVGTWDRVPSTLAYGISKRAANHITTALAAALPADGGSNVLINALAPGPTASSMLPKDFDPKKYGSFRTTEEVAADVVKLALLPNGSATGQVLLDRKY